MGGSGDQRLDLLQKMKRESQLGADMRKNSTLEGWSTAGSESCVWVEDLSLLRNEDKEK